MNDSMEFATPEAAVLRQTQLTVPFNNIARIFRLLGQDVDARLGGDCLYQAAQFRRLVHACVADATVTLHNTSGQGCGGHIFPVTHSERGTLLHEITEMGQFPIRIDTMESGQRTVIATFPLFPQGSRRFCAQWLRPASHLLTWIEQGNCETLFRQNTVNVAEPIAASDDRHPVHPPTAKAFSLQLALHTLDRDGGKSYAELHAISGEMEAGRIGGAHYSNIAQRRAFGTEFERIAHALGVRRNRLMEFFMEGWRFQQLLHPEIQCMPVQRPKASEQD